jgi:hypothetical protein
MKATRRVLAARRALMRKIAHRRKETVNEGKNARKKRNFLIWGYAPDTVWPVVRWGS